MSEPFNATNHGQEHHFGAFLDALVTGGTSRDDESTHGSASASASDLGIFARELHQASIPRLSPARKEAIWNDLLLAHPSPNHPRRAGGTGPMLPPALTIPASRPPGRRSRLRDRMGDPRLGFVPPFVMRPATIVMLTVAMMLAAVAGLAGLGQSKDPGSLTPTALASEHLIVATPMPCSIASPIASPSSTSTGILTSTTSTPAIANASSETVIPTTPIGTPACAAAEAVKTPPPPSS
jgi:hypothetical protein